MKYVLILLLFLGCYTDYEFGSCVGENVTCSYNKAQICQDRNWTVVADCSDNNESCRIIKGIPICY